MIKDVSPEMQPVILGRARRWVASYGPGTQTRTLAQVPGAAVNTSVTQPLTVTKRKPGETMVTEKYCH